MSLVLIISGVVEPKHYPCPGQFGAGYCTTLSHNYKIVFNYMYFIYFKSFLNYIIIKVMRR